MATVIPFPQKELSVKMNFSFSGDDTWQMEYIFDHGDTHYVGLYTDESNHKFSKSVLNMMQVFTKQFCASNDEAG